MEMRKKNIKKKFLSLSNKSFGKNNFITQFMQSYNLLDLKNKFYKTTIICIIIVLNY